MAVNVIGLVGIVVFYFIILGIGIWAAVKRKKNLSRNRVQVLVNGEEGAPLTESEDVMLAGRNIGLFVGAMTMTGRNYKILH